MRLIRRTSRGQQLLPDGCVATIGTFDGVHLGHQEILARVREQARRAGLPALVFSFEPTPAEFFQGAGAPARLTRFREKYCALRDFGMDFFFCPPFDGRMSRLSPRAFIDELLLGVLGVKHVVVGDDFRFAHQRSGRFEDLAEAGKRQGFTAEQLSSVMGEDTRVSSTTIRRALQAGDMQRARRWLGRYYQMVGRVVPGRKLGKQLGYPTANVRLARHASAVQGIFAVRVAGLGETRLDGVASLGTRPTVEGGGEPLLEVHLFDFDRDIYGQYIWVEFIARLRDEERFDGLDSLTRQMHIDAAQAREILAATPMD